MQSLLPRHVAIIMDGNRRWAQKHNRSHIEGHHAGANNALEIVKYLDSRGVQYVTLYSFSTENWNRPAEEVNELMAMLEQYIEKEAHKLDKLGFRINHLGRMDRLSDKLKTAVQKAVEKTRHNTGINVNFAFDYGSRTEIIGTIRKILAMGCKAEKVDEELVNSCLYTAGMPDVDLLVRTGGEIRISNFLLWQLAYSELYFSPVLWPDFGPEEMSRALEAFVNRERRFGGN